MAYRIVTQVIFVGARILSRSFGEAYRQAQAGSKYARAQAAAGNTTSTGRANLASGMTFDEAQKILAIKPLTTAPGPGGKGTVPAPTAAEMEEIFARFKRLFDANEPKNGGSFYLQSKILRARERIEAEARPAMEKAAQEAEVKGGFKPKMYKDK